MAVEEARLKASLLMNVANVFDLMTTLAGLEAGLEEGNPLARYILKRLGVAHFSAIKLAMPLTLSLASELIDTPRVKARYGLLMSVIATIFALASINNLLLLSLRKALIKK